MDSPGPAGDGGCWEFPAAAGIFLHSNMRKTWVNRTRAGNFQRTQPQSESDRSRRRIEGSQLDLADAASMPFGTALAQRSSTRPRATPGHAEARWVTDVNRMSIYARAIEDEEPGMTVLAAKSMLVVGNDSYQITFPDDARTK